MNISLSWLKKYIDLDLSADEVGKALTSIGLEVGGIEEYETIRGGLRGLVVGKVLTCRDHTNSDHLHVTTVDLGAELSPEPVQIVCGAPNIAAGQTVIVATEGTTLYNGDESFKIKKSKIRGEESRGMICSEVEIGVGTSHDGIMVLPDDLPAGLPAASYFNLESDSIIEVDITPNRVDATSHIGVARDLYAYLHTRGIKTALRLPDCTLIQSSSEKPIEVTIQNPEACYRYSGIIIKGAKIAASPEWLKRALESIGQKSINNLVDVTNYVLHEMGQPLHAFDLAKIEGGINVRLAREGEKLTTLDGIERTLTDRDLVICDNKRPLCLAGVMGGIDSGISETTTDLFIESATFSPTFIRKSARRHTLSSDSSFRFERGLDPAATLPALKRAAALINELAGGEVASVIYDLYPTPLGAYPVSLSFAKIDKLVGIEIPQEKVRSILSALEIKILSEQDGTMQLEVPRYRYDVTRDVDVIEEILRIYGYNEVPLTGQMSCNIAPAGDTDKSIRLQQVISEQLVGAGFFEILNNSLSKESYYTTEEQQQKAVCLLNPLSSDLAVMRQTMLFGGLESIAFNLNRKASALRLFEFGSCYERVSENTKTPLRGYKESYKLAIWMTGDKASGNWIQESRTISIFELKSVVYQVLQRLGISPAELEYSNIDNDHYFALGESMRLHGGAEVVRWGIVASQHTKAADIDCPIFFAEIDWNALILRSLKRKLTIGAIPKYPAVKRDFALLVDNSVAFVDIERIAYSAERKLLQSIVLFDVYEDPKRLPEGKKSYAVSFELQDFEKTLSEQQIEKSMARIYEAIHKELGATLR